MKIVIAPDSFKESLTALQVATEIEAGGKTPMGVARLAKRYNKPVIGIAGSVSADAGVVHLHGIDAVFSVLRQVGTLEDAISQAAANVRIASRNIAACFKLGR